MSKRTVPFGTKENMTMDVGKMIVELLYWIVEGACFLFSSSMLVTHFLGYAPRKGRGGKCVLLVVWK